MKNKIIRKCGFCGKPTPATEYTNDDDLFYYYCSRECEQQHIFKVIELVKNESKIKKKVLAEIDSWAKKYGVFEYQTQHLKKRVEKL